ncbi:MAG: hypothetical protein ACLQPI_13200, partial [Limisphaerales bacterium]
ELPAGGYTPAGSWSKETKCVTSNQNSVTDVLTHECYRCSDCAKIALAFSVYPLVFQIDLNSIP